MGFTRSKANEILNGLFPNDSTKKNYTYIALSTTEPDVNGGNVTEPSSESGYKRMKVEVMGSASNGQIKNTDIIFFPESLGEGYGTIVAFGLYSTQTGGTPYYTGMLKNANGELAPIQVPAGYIPIFRAGALIIGLDKDELDVQEACYGEVH